jgi:hypothetical protein
MTDLIEFETEDYLPGSINTISVPGFININNVASYSGNEELTEVTYICGAQDEIWIPFNEFTINIKKFMEITEKNDEGNDETVLINLDAAYAIGKFTYGKTDNAALIFSIHYNKHIDLRYDEFKKYVDLSQFIEVKHDDTDSYGKWGITTMMVKRNIISTIKFRNNRTYISLNNCDGFYVYDSYDEIKEKLAKSKNIKRAVPKK